MARKQREYDLGALDTRAHIAALETTNAHLAARVAELSFLADVAVKLGATLDESAIAQTIVDAVAVATNARSTPRFLLLRIGNALVYAVGAMLDPHEAQIFVRYCHGDLERCLRIGDVTHAAGYAAVPIPGEPHEPGLGCIVVREADGKPLDRNDRRRLRRLADLAGRSLGNARLLARSITAGVTDELTGVFNRRYFERRLADELKRARRLGERMGLLILDLDYFKTVNDRYGHPEGDRALRAVAESIAASVRDIDVVTRWGGEEFAVIVPGADGFQALEIAERIRAAVSALRLTTASGESFGITVSCGVAWAAKDIHTPAQCVAAADRCLLEAKRGGRNRTIGMHMPGSRRAQGRPSEMHEAALRGDRGQARDA